VVLCSTLLETSEASKEKRVTVSDAAYRRLKANREEITKYAGQINVQYM